MRRLIWIVIVLAGLFCGWWVLAAAALERGLAVWLDDRRADGWQAEMTVLPVAGFPARFDLGLMDITLADPAIDQTLRMQGLQVTARSYWPGDLTVTFPDTPIALVAAYRTLSIEAKGAQVALRLHPGPTLELDRLRTTSGVWQVAITEGTLFQATDANAEISQGETSEIYHFALSADKLVPGGNIRTALELPLNWPLAFDDFASEVTVTFDAPLNRFTLEDQRPHPRRIEVQNVEAQWGPLRMVSTGDVSIDSKGTLEGRLDLLVENWRTVLDLAERSGAMQARLRPQAELMLNALANMGANPDTLDLTLTFHEGGMFLGQIPLGPAPRLTLP